MQRRDDPRDRGRQARVGGKRGEHRAGRVQDEGFVMTVALDAHRLERAREFDRVAALPHRAHRPARRHVGKNGAKLVEHRDERGALLGLVPHVAFARQQVTEGGAQRERHHHDERERRDDERRRSGVRSAAIDRARCGGRQGVTQPAHPGQRLGAYCSTGRLVNSVSAGPPLNEPPTSSDCKK